MSSLTFGSLTAHGGFALSALAFFADEVPNEDAVAVSGTVGWLTFAAALAFIVILILHNKAWRKWWLTAEDPRAQGLYRIVFGLMVMANMTDFAPYWHMLFTDEGIFTADVARQVHASHQFAGYGDGFTKDSPAGFFDLWAVLRFLEGPKYSLLYFWDSPTFFAWHMAAFYVCAFMLVIGFRTRFFAVLTWFLMNSVFYRNHLFWEGTELVYRCFLVYLVLSRAGHAFSVDNWLRCRRLRAQKRLSTRDGPGNGAGVAPSDEHPAGLEPIYRLIPSWPRKLAMLQLATIYTTTGILKNGSVWARGDAIYYAWNMDHFYRFYPQFISSIIGTNILRISTWVTHWGEIFFGIIFLGCVIRFAIREKIPALRGPQALLAYACWSTIFIVSGALIWVTWDVHYVPIFGLIERLGARLGVPRGHASRLVYVGAWVVGWFVLWRLWARIGRVPVRVRGRTGLWILWGGLLAGVSALTWAVLFPLATPEQSMSAAVLGSKAAIVGAIVLAGVALPILLRRVAKVRPYLEHVPIFTDEFLTSTHDIDQEWVSKWIVGRRIWLTFHVALMGGIFVLMNIGWFQPGMLSQTFAFLHGAEAAIIVQWVAHQLRLTPFKTPVPAQDPTLPTVHRDAARVPQWALFIGLGFVVSGILVRIFLWTDKLPWTRDWRLVWLLGLAFLAGVAWWNARQHRREQLSLIDPDTERVRVPWAYGPLGRFVVSGFLIWHITAVATWLLPDKDSLKSWRGPARDVFAKYLTVTTTDQGWGMFAPNPPRSNVFLKVLVTTEDGEVYDLKSDVYAPERKPMPFIINDRMRKMNRRIIGGESGNSEWYRKWYARWVCRDWGMSHDGIEPKKVDLVKIWYRIPGPEETLRRGWYRPEELLDRSGSEKIEHTEYCRTTVLGQIPNAVRERHGLPPLRKDWRERPWLKHKKRKWDAQMRRWRGEDTPAQHRRGAHRGPQPKRKPTTKTAKND